MPRIHHLLICCAEDAPPDPSEVAAALRALGHEAQVTEERSWLLTARTFELAVVPNRTRILIEVSEDFHAGTDLSTGDWEMVQDLAARGMINRSDLPTIRRVVHIGHWDHADASSVQALLDFLEQRMQGRVVDYPS